MAFALAKQQLQFIERMIRSGRYNSQSEVVRAALRRMEETEGDYLRPPVLSAAQVKRMYGPDLQEETRERSFGKGAFSAVRRAARKGRRP